MLDQNLGGTPAGAADLDVRIGFRSERGARERNEDFGAFCAAPKDIARLGVIAAVADGVGGSKGGRVAAEVAVRTVMDGYFGGAELQGVRTVAARGIAAANAWIHALGKSDRTLASMACTLTALILRGRLCHLLHIGDSRAYRFRDGVLEQLTTDHTPGLPGYRNVLTRAVGAAPHVGIDYAAVSLAVHDRLLLCTDGVHGVLSVSRISAILAGRDDPEAAADELVRLAIAGRGGDNATALVLDVVGLPAAGAADLEQGFRRKPVLPLPRLNQIVDGFMLEALLGDGRYTRVFRARDTVEKRPVVLKFPKPLTETEAMLRQAFMRETWIAGRVRSPWVGEALDVPVERRSGIYVVMPFYDGETLERRLARPAQLSLAAGLDLAQKLARGVAALHRAGIVHRDIKPDNVILEPPRPKRGAGLRLIDLGVARLPNMEEFPIAHAPGTPSYMAPELFGGALGDEKSDQFALGVTIYRMFTGAYPYGEIEPFTRPRFKAATPLQAHRPDLPAWLDRALSRAVAVAPGDRFDDVLELAFEFEHGAVRAEPLKAEKRPFYDRNPTAVWQAVAAVLFVCLIVAVFQLAHIRTEAGVRQTPPDRLAH